MRGKQASPPNGRHTAIYLRVSSAGQLERFGYKAQESQLTALCEQRGWTRPLIYGERDAPGGKIQQRHKLQELLQRIKAGEVERVVVFDIDRLSRESDPREWAEIAGTCLDAECPIITPTTTYDFAGDASAGLMGFIKQWGAAEERKAIVRRGVGGRRESAKRGRWHALKVPFGYVLNEETKGLDVEPAAAAIVEAMYRRYLDGQGFHQIRDWLNSEGVGGKKWGHTSVARILGSRTYTGEATWGGVTVPVPAIIPVDLFDAVLRERKRRKAHAWRAKPKHAFLLRGMVRCGECGGAMAPQVMGPLRYYRCVKRMRDRSCKAKKSIRAEKLHTTTWSILRQLALYHECRDGDSIADIWMSDPLEVPLAFVVGRPVQRFVPDPAHVTEPEERDRTTSRVLETQLEDVEAQIGRIVTAIGNETITEEHAAPRLRELDAQRQTALAALQEVVEAEEAFRQAQLSQAALREAFAGLRSVLEVEKEKPEAEAASFVQEHINWLSVLPSGKIEVCFRVVVEGGWLEVTGHSELPSVTASNRSPTTGRTGTPSNGSTAARSPSRRTRSSSPSSPRTPSTSATRSPCPMRT